MEELAERPRRISRLNLRGTSMEHLHFYEQLVLSKLTTNFLQYMVPIELNGELYEINTIETIPLGDSFVPVCKYPLVLIHGFGAGLGTWVKNIDALASRYKLFAFDSLGCGKSSRPKFPTTPEEAEDFFVDSIEAWRKSLKLEQLVLLGHSFGGFQATSYATRFPHRVKYLILADPWGFPPRPAGRLAGKYPFYLRVMSDWLRALAPFAILRACGPLGPRIMTRVRPDLGEKFSDLLDNDKIIYQYIYHLNAQTPSGELGFAAVTMPYGFAHRPMIERVHKLDPSLPVTFIYGEKSMQDLTMGERMKQLRPDSPVDWHILKDCTHLVNSGIKVKHIVLTRADNHYEFNSIVLRAVEYLHEHESAA